MDGFGLLQSRSVVTDANPPLEIQAQFEALGVQPRMVTPQELTAFVAGEAKRWTDVARDAKIEKE